MTLYTVENQWGGSSAPWNNGGLWVIGARGKQYVVALDAKSDDKGKTLNGTMTYEGEGPIGFRATRNGANNYTVENQWGGDKAPWHKGGEFVLGYRADQNMVALDIKSDDGGETLNGTMTYDGEGPIGFKSSKANGGVYNTQNQWGGDKVPWHPGGVFVLGRREKQNVVGMNIKSDDGGKTFKGSMTYKGEGPIEFKATQSGDTTNYDTQVRWGGSSAPWRDGGTCIIGYREDQNVVALEAKSEDGGKSLNGDLTYKGEGPIGFKGELSGNEAKSATN